MKSATALLARETDSLRRRVAGWSPSRFAVAALTPASGSRGDRLHALVRELARLSAVAGAPVPPDAAPPRLGDHALADQLAVVTQELLAAPGLPAVAPAALAEVLATRTALDGTAPPRDAVAAAGR